MFADSSNLTLLLSDPIKLSEILYQHGARERRNRLVKIIEAEALFNKQSKFFLSREQLLQRAFKIQLRLLELLHQHNWTEIEWHHVGQLMDDPLPFTLHEGAFIPVIKNQGTKEQIKEWIPRCERYEILGCYAQTELGHGSNVQGLETIAKYLKHTDEFEIHTPNLQASKWWIGGLGHMCTHAVVQANLILPDDHSKPKGFGPHLFIVPLRSLNDHKPLPGCTLGDIGPKVYGGFGSIDNGFARFDRVRIPRSYMLSRNSKVTSDGKFVPAKHDKLSYGSMVALRAIMPETVGWDVGRAATIAIRYCSFRRQFNPDEHGLERPVITYNSVKRRLFPILAQAYAILFAGCEMKQLYHTMLDRLVNEEDISLLAETHSLSSALKAVSTWDGVRDMEEARKCMGGHGFSAFSGIGHIFANSAPSQTYEGDNYLLCQQTARGILKHVLSGSENKDYLLPRSSTYLNLLKEGSQEFCKARCQVKVATDWLDHNVQIEALSRRAASLVAELVEKFRENIDWNDLNWHCVRVTRAHAELYIINAFIRKINSIEDVAISNILKHLSQILAMHYLTEVSSDLFEIQFVSPEQIRLLRDQFSKSIDDLSPHVLHLTDAFDFTDYELNSALGSRSESPYENLWKAAQADPTNIERKDDVNLEFTKYIKPMLEFHKKIGNSKL
ncbi:Peroxisomal acyl-coenzyme A oxidase 1 [Neolecta irregularis DAH-3]|uniref:Acyl-coenzyme A oxidase n=1 Tax=Neolecta irregularis (strain DAH-3) TaxID=1198029 RepID=A0A1U7LK36_NEOID|nr:Peroxisomal acyl-coenzyme A oxidase 1 [Neolecta irregularis DAH-3]|eukprot:OLL23017.1 Peroxisomal acyl-coenzyme A oxidase 1 [Neolecta irregularis DAH-3]